MPMNPRLLRPLAFNPKSIAGLSAWYDATASSSLRDSVSGGGETLADGAVMRWQDLSGNENHLTQPDNVVNNAPVRKVADINTAGKDSVLFDGSNDFLEVTSTIQTGSGGSIFIVHKRVSDNSGGIHSFSGVSTPNHHPFASAPFANRFFDGFANGTRRAWFQPYSTTRRLYSIVSGTSWVAYMNNQAVNTIAGTAPASQYPGRAQGFGQGIKDSVSAESYICEILVYGRALTNTEHSAVSNYLINKWSL